jgi:esterase
MVKLFHREYPGPDNVPGLVIMHGLFGSSDNWHNIAQQLADNFRVVTVDLRNHGNSPHHPDMNYQVMAEDVIALVEELFPGEAVHLLGHSMGGKVAMSVASARPDLINKLVVADIAPRAYKAGHTEIIEAMKRLDLSEYNRRSEAEEDLKKYIKSTAIALFILKNIERVKTGGYRWKINLPVIEENYESIIGSVKQDWPFTAPTLFIKGDRSDYISEQDELMIPEQYLNVKFQTVANAGHWIHADNPSSFLEVLKDFLN